MTLPRRGKPPGEKKTPEPGIRACAVFRRRAKKGAPSERKGLPLIRGKNQAFAFWVRTRRISSVKRGTILQTSPTTP